LKRVLFIDETARARGPTAAQIFAERADLRTDFAGVGRDASDVVSAEQIDWADLVLCMERRQATRLGDLFRTGLRGKPVVVLDIRDRYSFMQPELVEELKLKAGQHMR
jgi:predicted protein tyrosine phosphatase